jgi:hypothetical protein
LGREVAVEYELSSFAGWRGKEVYAGTDGRWGEEVAEGDELASGVDGREG